MDSCATLAVAEAQINANHDSSNDPDLIYKAIEKHLKCLPLRYVLSIENPSEVLLHMRLMNAARTTMSTAAIHIAPLDPNEINSTLSMLHLPQTFKSDKVRGGGGAKRQLKHYTALLHN